MYAVVGQVKVDPQREEEARKLLEDFVVPSARGLAGFAGGTWARALDGDTGHSLLLFDSEENARAAATQVAEGPPPGAPVSFVSVSVGEVVAQTEM
jgi:hypothetical protein